LGNSTCYKEKRKKKKKKKKKSTRLGVSLAIDGNKKSKENKIENTVEKKFNCSPIYRLINTKALRLIIGDGGYGRKKCTNLG
jgi:hypothetical protein